MTSATAWWHGPAGHFYNCLVDDPSETSEEEQMFEIAVHNVVPPASLDKTKKFSWGIPATNERVESHFTEYDPRVRKALSRVPQGLWKEFSAFTGPRLEKLVAWNGKVVLIGDASHPLTGEPLSTFFTFCFWFRGLEVRKSFMLMRFLRGIRVRSRVRNARQLYPRPGYSSHALHLPTPPPSIRTLNLRLNTLPVLFKDV